MKRQAKSRSTTKEGIIGRLGKDLENPLVRERLEFLQTVRDTDESAARASGTPRTSNDRVRKLALGTALLGLGLGLLLTFAPSRGASVIGWGGHPRLARVFGMVDLAVGTRLFLGRRRSRGCSRGLALHLFVPFPGT